MEKTIVEQFNIHYKGLEMNEPLSVGNGNLAVTVDGLGTQTFYQEYQQIPLVSMSHTCWITNPNIPQIEAKCYQAHGHKVRYFTDSTNQEEDYKALRSYPYQFHFFLYQLFYKDHLLEAKDVKDVDQELNIYDGILTSTFSFQERKIQTICKVDEKKQVFRFEIKHAKNLHIRIYFPKSSSSRNASLFPLCDTFEWNAGKIIRHTENESFLAFLHTNTKITKQQEYLDLEINDAHAYFEISIGTEDQYLEQASFFADVKTRLFDPVFDGLEEEQCQELNRRLILSIYLLKVNSSGKYPASETGLTLNSWNSKFHLEMHPWHSLWMAKYGLEERLKGQLEYYLTIVKQAQERAEYQGYQGARLPKMTSPEGEDSPSNIGPLLLWQQPHLFLMLDAIYQVEQNKEFIKKYYPLLLELIVFLESFVYLGEDGFYHLDQPIIPAQECFDPILTKDPIFEVEYVRYAFQKIIEFSRILNIKPKEHWQEIIDHLVLPAQNECYYLACHDAQGKETYDRFAFDHPLVLMPYSLLMSDRIDPEKMKKTYDQVLKTYDLEKLWGWDFPMMAMTAIHLGLKKEALEMLLCNTSKNQYLKNGHNPQGSRKDLPIYLPGNGAFLLAAYECLSKKGVLKMNNYYSELPSNYVEDKVIDAKSTRFGIYMNIVALVLMILVLVPFYFLKMKDVEVDNNQILLALVVFLAAYVAYIVAHELTHGVAYKLLTKQKLTFGFSWSCAYCGVPNGYVNKKTALISLLAPFVVHSIWMLILIFVLPNSIWISMIILLFASHFGGCVGDFYCTYLLVFKYHGKAILMNDTGPKQTFYIEKKTIELIEEKVDESAA